MTVLSYSRHLIKRQEVLKQRRFFDMPKAWKFTHDQKNYYLTFDERLASKLYFKKRKHYKVPRVKWYV